MNPVFLPYKYKLLKTFQQYNEKSIINLGWKCRKYIRWDAVHIDENDRSLLKEFGDLAVDKKTIDKHTFPRINQILLNVQKWRLDKDNFTVEPEHERAWDKAFEIISAANESTDIISSYTCKIMSNCDSFSDDELKQYFIGSVLADFIITFDAKLSIDYQIIENEDPILEILNDYIVDTSIEINSLQSLNNHKQLNSILTDIGFPVFDFTSEIKNRDSAISSYEKEIIVYEECMSDTKLFRISNTSGVFTIYVNINNKFVQYALSKETSKECFFNFIKSYAQTYDENIAIQDQLDTFNSYLSLNLNRNFKK